MDDKKRLTLEDVFDENYKKYLLTLIWFRLHQLKDGNNNLMKFYTETLDNVLTQQFYITEKEFVMIFAKGEIAHRIYGDLVVGVPYSEIKPIMKMNLVE